MRAYVRWESRRALTRVVAARNEDWWRQSMALHERRHTRVKALLSSYYDDDDGADASDDHDGQSRTRSDGSARGQGDENAHSDDESRIDLNAKTFNATTYTRRITQTLGAEDAQAHYVALVKDLRSIESASQMLVYDNYARCARAASAASALGDATSRAEAQCSVLKDTVSRASERSRTTHRALSDRREVVEQLRGVRGLIRGMSEALRVADALSALSSDDAGTSDCTDTARSERAREVIMRYVESRAVIDALGGDGSTSDAFVEAKRRCDALAASVAERLKARARANAIGDGDGDGAECDAYGLTDDACLELLGALNVSQDELIDDFLASRAARLRATLMMTADASDGGASTSQAAPPLDMKAYISSLNQSFLGEFHAATEAFGKLFAKDASSRPALVKFTKDVFAEYFDVIRDVFAPLIDDKTVSPGSLLNPKQLMCAMGTMAADLSSIHRAIPEAALGDRAVEAIERAVRSRVNAAFVCLERDVVRGLDGALEASQSVLSPSSSKSLLQCFVAVSDTFLTSARSALADVEALMDERPILLSTWREEFACMVQGNFTNLIHALVARLIVGVSANPTPAPNPAPLSTPLGDAVKALTSTAAAAPPPPSFMLVCARLSSFLETSAVPHIATALTKMFPASAATGGGFDVASAREMCASTASVLLSAYVEQRAQRLGFMIRKSLTAVDWSAMREPREVRPLADFIAEDLDAIELECAQILDVGEIAGDDVDVDATQTSDDGCFTRVRATQSSVICAVMKRVVKSYAECVRCQIFQTKFAFQQVALDAQYLAERVLFRFLPSGQFAVDVDERRAIEALLTELKDAIRARALDPTPMDKAIVNRIIAGAGRATSSESRKA